MSSWEEVDWRLHKIRIENGWLYRHDNLALEYVPDKLNAKEIAAELVALMKVMNEKDAA